MLKEYGNIVKSGMLEMISAAKQNEYVKESGLLLFGGFLPKNYWTYAMTCVLLTCSVTFGMDGSHFSHGYSQGTMAFSDVRRLAEDTGIVFPDEIEWIKVEYSLCVFVFLVFALASGSILFMRLSNDAFEEKERYAILKKMGISPWTLSKAAARELLAAYAMPFLLIPLSSWFSVCSLEKLISKNLKAVNLFSVVIVFMFFAVFYGLSVLFYRKNMEIL